MMHRLRPGVLDNLGLVEALKDEIKAWNSRHPETICEYTFSGDLLNLGERINITLYRVVQECLTNISKYASATEVKISLSNNERGLSLTICDNGSGLSPQKNKTHTGLGIIGMRERADTLGGKFKIIFTPGQGTAISLTIPKQTTTKD